MTPPVHVTKDSLISIGLALGLGSLVFFAGVLFQKVTSLESLNLGDKLAKIQTDVAVIRQHLGLPRERAVSASSDGE